MSHDAGKYPHRATVGEFEAYGRLWNSRSLRADLEADRNPREEIEMLRRFPFRPTDVLVNTFPRTGTVIVQELIWRLVYGRRFPEAASESIDARFPFLDYNTELYPALPRSVDVLSQWPESRGPRLITTHFPYALIREAVEAARPRLIFNQRNPKDSAVALFHLYRGLGKYGPWAGDWDEFLHLFLAGRTMTGSYFDNVREWWALRDRPNVLILRYEDLVRQPHQEVRRVAAFLGLPRPSPEEETAVVEAISFRRMQDAPATARSDPTTGFNFVRRGKIGGWREQFTVEQSALMDAAVARHFGDDGPSFVYQ